MEFESKPVSIKCSDDYVPLHPPKLKCMTVSDAEGAAGSEASDRSINSGPVLHCKRKSRLRLNSTDSSDLVWFKKKCRIISKSKEYRSQESGVRSQNQRKKILQHLLSPVS